jgi:uncharacterized protein with PIN domain
MSYRFILDGMLGSLARWLRIIGYDTLYYVDKKDEELIFEANNTNRILISRDYSLVQNSLKKETFAILINSDNIINQLCEVTETLEINLSPKNTRCPRCNGSLKRIKKDLIREEIPEQSYKAFNEFWQCIECNRIYWKGSHWIGILDTLKKIQCDSKYL